MTRPLLAMTLAMATFLMPGKSFAADGTAGIGNGQLHVRLRVETPGIDALLELDAHTSTSQIIWDATDSAAGNGLNGLCAPEPIDDAHPILGALFHLVGRDRQTNEVVYDGWECVPFTDSSRPPKPSPPQLPTIEEAWRAAQLPTPVVRFDPPARGITGLDTIIDVANAHPVQIRATIRGYTIVGTATPARYTIQVDDDAPIETTTAHHTFEYKGRHTIRVGVIWRGVDSLSGGDLKTAITAHIGDASMTATRVYQVNEVRSVLQP